MAGNSASSSSKHKLRQVTAAPPSNHAVWWWRGVVSGKTVCAPWPFLAESHAARASVTACRLGFANSFLPCLQRTESKADTRASIQPDIG